MRKEVDVLVIGGGPGGSMTARIAAEGGADTLMIEKRQEIGAPVRCGEGIAKIWLDEMGIKPDSRWIAQEVDGARMISPSGHIYEMDAAKAGNETGYVVERSLFDKALAGDAAKAGADIWLRAMALGAKMDGDKVVEVKVNHLGEEVTIIPKIVIGVDGFESRVAGWVGLNSRIAPKDIDTCLQYRLAGIDYDRRFNDFYIGKSIAPGGYVWVFSKGDGIANVGIGVQLSRVKAPAEVKMYLDNFIASHPGLAQGSPVDMVAGAVSISLPMEKTVIGNTMLVGDAARMTDALTGGGVVNTCRSGAIAGKLAAEHVQSGESIADYEKLWRKQFENICVRNYFAKETAVKLKDEDFDRIVLAIQDLEVATITTGEILAIIGQACPDLMTELEALF